MTVTAPAGVAGRVILSGFMMADISHNNGTTDEIDTYFSTSATTCTTLTGFPYVPSGLPTDIYWQSLPLSADFAVAAGSTTTFYLNVIGFGNVTGESISYSRITAIFVPN